MFNGVIAYAIGSHFHFWAIGFAVFQILSALNAIAYGVNN